MTEQNPDNAPKQNGDEKGKPDSVPRIVRKRARINCPMPTLSPREKRIMEESRRLIRLYGRRKGQ